MDEIINKRVALVILESADGRSAMQLRDDKATIAHPNQWALFGGKIEEGERPFSAALREVDEELTIQLYRSQLAFLRSFRIEPGKEHHLFHYSVTDELDTAVLTEGQLYKQLSREEMQKGSVDGRFVVSSHLQMLNWFWRGSYHRRKLPQFSTLLSGRAPRNGIGFQSDNLQIWYNNQDSSWVGDGETPHKHAASDECFIVLKGILLVDVEGERFEVGPGEFCCFPSGVYHAIVEVRPPVETLMIRAPSVDDKIYRREAKEAK
ncbi:MAG: cupin domain-containing protein [Chloroflexi bacterium]|nr:cupin domain-containing protein [Chloroflexota bacterium]